MQIGIIGAGSIGLLFAANLSTFCRVNIYCRTEAQAREINSNGVILQNGLVSHKAIVQAYTIEEWKGAEELTIIAVKQYQLKPVLEKINTMHKQPENLLFLQNGMGHLKQLENIKANNIFVGSVEHGAFKIAPAIVTHNGAGVTNIALYKGKGTVIEKFSSLAPSSFPFPIKPDYQRMLLNKLIINACINPLTAILQVQNGALIENQQYLTAMSALFSEISSILDLQPPDPYWQQVISVCQKTANNRSSMLKDIEANRRTEIDAILGYLLEEAMLQGKKAPLLTCLYTLVKGKEIERGAAG